MYIYVKLPGIKTWTHQNFYVPLFITDDNDNHDMITIIMITIPSFLFLVVCLAVCCCLPSFVLQRVGPQAHAPPFLAGREQGRDQGVGAMGGDAEVEKGKQYRRHPLQTAPQVGFLFCILQYRTAINCYYKPG